VGIVHDRDILRRLEAAVGVEGLLGSDEVATRATSFWDAAPMRALALVRPRTTDEVSAALKVCHELGQQAVVIGGLTGAVSGAVPDAGKVVLSLERMTAVEAIDVVDGTCTVQAGASLQAVQERVAGQGLLFPLDLGARGSCTIGGNIATNAGGISVLRYGMMRSLVLGIEAVLADGTVLSTMNALLKNNAGYDLKQLFIGTEGTLGVVTRAVLRLFPQPASRQTALVAVDDFDRVTRLLGCLRSGLGGNLSAFEVMWASYFTEQTRYRGSRGPFGSEHAFYVVVEAEGPHPERDEAAFETVLEEAFEGGLVEDAVIAKSGQERRELWDLREDLEAVLQSDTVYLYDVGVPMRHMPAYVSQVEQGLQRRWPGCRCYTMGHIADGNVHFFVQPGRAGTTQAESDEEVYGPLQQYGGTISAEHGIGVDKKTWLIRNRSPAELATMQALKRLFDPRGILNSGRVIDT